MTIEKKTKSTILQDDFSISIAGKKYVVEPQSTGTLIMVSAISSNIPYEKPVSDDREILFHVLSNAKNYAFVSDIIATMIIGARRLKHPFIFIRMYWEYRLRCMSRRILNKATTDELTNAMITLLGRMRVSDFFGLTTFLQEVNLTRETRKVVN